MVRSGEDCITKIIMSCTQNQL